MPISPLRRAAAAAAVAAVGATASLPGAPASAQATCYPPTANCNITTTTTPSGPAQALTLNLSATSVTRGQTITATVAGFRPGARGTLSIASVEQQLGTFTASAGGTASANITIPRNISLGAHTIFARGAASNGTAGSVSRPITVVTGGVGGVGGGGRSLARTGAVVVPSAIVGLGLIAGGAAIKRASRRSTSTSKA